MLKALLATATVLMTSMPVLAESSHDDHVRLFDTVKEVGVRVYINPGDVCDPEVTGKGKFYGFYAGANQMMVICQEKALKSGVYNQQYSWTEEDYDTLRHEAHHMVQDCMDRTLDAKLDSVYDKPTVFASNILTKRKFNWVVETYTRGGRHMVVMELEAFGVAEQNNPLEQIKDIKRYCM